MDPEKLARQEERRRQWAEYRVKKAVRSAAEKKFRDDIKQVRREARKSWPKTSGIEVSIPAGDNLFPGGSVLLGITANPSASARETAGILLSRPADSPNAAITKFSKEGVRKFAAALEEIQSDSGMSDEDALFLLEEGAAHLSGHASRIEILVEPAQGRDWNATADSFQSTWMEVQAGRQDIRSFEDKRLLLSEKTAKAEKEVRELELNLEKASQSRRLKLEAKREKKRAMIKKLKSEAASAKKQESAAAEKTVKKAERIISSCLVGATCD